MSGAVRSPTSDVRSGKGRPETGDRRPEGVRRRIAPPRGVGPLAAALIFATAAFAQQPAPLPPGARIPTTPGVDNPHGPAAAGLRRVAGRVVRLTAKGLVAVPGKWATLHRIGPDAQGPVDSIRTGGDGGYHFSYRVTGSDRAIYVVTAMHDGIAYFTPPLKGVAVRDDAAAIRVFDTTSRTAALAVRGRHVVVSAADTSDRGRTVLEIFEVSNDSTRTLVGRDSSAPTWTSVLPAGAREVRMEQGDVPPDAMTSEPGRLRIHAPFAPGIKQFSFSYKLPAAAFPLTMPVESATPVVEVLVEDPSARARGATLTEVNAVSVDGRPFKRFLAQNAERGATLTIDIPAAPGTARVAPLIAIVAALGVAMLVGLASATMRRGGGAARRAGRPDDPERIAREIADLDRAFDRQATSTGDGTRTEYQAARAALKARLTLALARRDGDA